MSKVLQGGNQERVGGRDESGGGKIGGYQLVKRGSVGGTRWVPREGCRG